MRRVWERVGVAAGMADSKLCQHPSKPHPRRPLAGADPTEPEAHLPPGRDGGEETTHRVPGGPHDPGGGGMGKRGGGQPCGCARPPRAHHSLRRRTRPCLAPSTSRWLTRDQGIKKQGIT